MTTFLCVMWSSEMVLLPVENGFYLLEKSDTFLSSRLRGKLQKSQVTSRAAV